MADLLTDPVVEFFVQLGALAGLLGFIYLFMRSQDKKANAELEARIARDKQEQVTRKERDEFIESIVTEANIRQDKQVESIVSLTKETIETFKGYTDAINELAKTQRESCEAIVKSNNELHNDHSQLYTEMSQVSRGLTLVEGKMDK